MNRVELIGRLTRDPELRYTNNNLAVCSFSIAVHRPFKNEETGDYDVDYIMCKSFKKRGETISKYCKKGDLVGVEGSIRTGSYENDKGDKVYTTDIMVENIHFLSPKSNNQTEEKQAEIEPKKDDLSDEVFAQFGESIEISDDDIAF